MQILFYFDEASNFLRVFECSLYGHLGTFKNKKLHPAAKYSTYIISSTFHPYPGRINHRRPSHSQPLQRIENLNLRRYLSGSIIRMLVDKHRGKQNEMCCILLFFRSIVYRHYRILEALLLIVRAMLTDIYIVK